MGVFTFQGNKYPTNEYFIQVRGDNVGIKSIHNNDWIITPQPFDTYWGEASVQDAINTIGADLFSVGASIDPDAQLVIDRMTGLTSTEETAINNFVIAEKAASNYSLYDEFFCLSLGATNGLVGFKSKTASPFGGTTWSVNGAKFNGTTGVIHTGFNPNVDGVNYSLSDALIGSFVKELNNANVIVGAHGSINSWSYLRDGALNLNTTNGTATFNISGGDLAVIARTGAASNNTRGYINGIENTINGNIAVDTPNTELVIGALSDNGTLSAYFNGTTSTMLIGGAVGFDQVAHNTNVRSLLTELGVTL